MCSTSALGSLRAIGGSFSGVLGAPMISAAMAKVSLGKYFLIDVREPGESIVAPAVVPPGVQQVPLGMLLRTAYDRKLEEQPWYPKDKTLLTLCNVGMRAKVAADELSRSGYNAAYVPRGMLEWGNPAATKPDYICLMSTKNPEFVHLALTAAKTAQSNGLQTVLVAMSDGVDVFRKPGVQGCTEKDTVIGMETIAPFTATNSLWTAFKESGGVAVLCTTCAKSRKLEQTDTLEGTNWFGMPDLVRMQQECSSVISFS